jgi:hypothetical protein
MCLQLNRRWRVTFAAEPTYLCNVLQQTMIHEISIKDGQTQLGMRNSQVTYEANTWL